MSVFDAKTVLNILLRRCL